jgi:hypothetical protein
MHFKNINKDNIDIICKTYNIKNYIINSDMSINVDGDVNLRNKSLKSLPLKFNKVSGDFICSFNILTSLKGCPIEVGGDFICYWNLLMSLEGCPEKVGGDFSCYKNKLTSLLESPKKINGNFNCSVNELTSLKGCPKEVCGDFYCFENQLDSFCECPEKVSGDFYCFDNKITSFEHLPLLMGGEFNCYNNPIYNIWELFEDYDRIDFFNDCDPIREPDIIILDRLNFFLEKIGKDPVKKIEKYKCV